MDFGIKIIVESGFEVRQGKFEKNLLF